MSNAKFTKGPWEIRGNDIGVFDTGETQAFGMMIIVANTDASDASPDESKLNANLIASAPEMYQELEDLKWEFHCECGHPRCSREQTKRKIEAILAKARGES